MHSFDCRVRALVGSVSVSLEGDAGRQTDSEEILKDFCATWLDHGYLWAHRLASQTLVVRKWP